MKKFSFILIATMVIGILLSVSFSQEPVAYSIVIDTEWQLTITGLVNKPLNLTLADLIAMEQTTINAQLFCVGPPSFLVDEGNWTGVKLKFLLERAEISPAAIKVAFYAYDDDFSTDLTIVSAMNDSIIVAYEKDGVPLNEKLRLVVPGRWGYKWIHSLNNIELVDYDFLGRYEGGDYSDSAEIASTGAPGDFPNPSGGTTPNTNSATPAPSLSPSPATIQTPSPTPTPQPTEKPTGTPTGLGLTEETIYIAAALAVVLVVSVSLIVYFVKFQKKKAEK